MYATGGVDFLDRLARAEARDAEYSQRAGERRMSSNDGGFMSQSSTKVMAPPGGKTSFSFGSDEAEIKSRMQQQGRKQNARWEAQQQDGWEAQQQQAMIQAADGRASAAAAAGASAGAAAGSNGRAAAAAARGLRDGDDAPAARATDGRLPAAAGDAPAAASAATTAAAAACRAAHGDRADCAPARRRSPCAGRVPASRAARLAIAAAWDCRLPSALPAQPAPQSHAPELAKGPALAIATPADGAAKLAAQSCVAACTRRVAVSAQWALAKTSPTECPWPRDGVAARACRLAETSGLAAPCGGARSWTEYSKLVDKGAGAAGRRKQHFVWLNGSLYRTVYGGVKRLFTWVAGKRFVVGKAWR